MKFLRLGKYYHLRFIRLQGDPKSLAMGTVIGRLVLALPFTIASYFYSQRLFITIRQKKQRKLARQQ